MTTLVEFKKLVHKSIRIITYTALYKEFKWQCRECKAFYTYKSAAQVLRRQLPCMCLEKQEYQAKLPKDVELVDYNGATKPCIWKCLRCSTIRQGKPYLLTNKVNCRCDGFAGSITKSEFLLRLKQSKLPYTLVTWTDPTIKRSLRLAEFKCNVGHVFKAKPQVLLNGKHVCPACKSNALAETYAILLAKAYPHIEVLKYGGAHALSLHRCTKCSTKFRVSQIVTKNTVRRSGCPKCDYRSGGPKLKTVEFGDRIVQVQGYENAALQYLEQHTNIKTAKLATCKAEGVPNIRYRYANKMRLYYPDFYYSPKNRLVEVKSIFTLLSVDYRKTKAKAKACMSQGYEFKLLVVEINKKTKEFAFVYKLPSNWLQMSRKDLLDFLCDEYPVKANKLRSLPTRNPYVATHH